MRYIRFTLLPDGPSDRALLPILTWLLRQHCSGYAIQSQWADFRPLRNPPRELHHRIRGCMELFPCDLLFIHRDAERQTREMRLQEIEEAIVKVEVQSLTPRVCVIPVRMQEAWLLIDEAAIRRAAANPAGRQRLNLPPLTRLERLPDPKRVLYRVLSDASGLTGRRRERLNLRQLAYRVTELIGDFSPLRNLSAFTALEADLIHVVREQRWDAFEESAP